MRMPTPRDGWPPDRWSGPGSGPRRNRARHSRHRQSRRGRRRARARPRGRTDGRTHRRSEFARDLPLEGAVTSELVSEARNQGTNSMIYNPNSLRIGTGGPRFDCGPERGAVASHSTWKVSCAQISLLNNCTLRILASCEVPELFMSGAATHHVWYSLEGGPYSGTRIRGDSYRFPRVRHCELA